MRRAVAVFSVLALAAAGCAVRPTSSAPAPSREPIDSTRVGPSGVAVSPEPPPSVISRIAIDSVTALTPADDGVWYLRGAEGAFQVGHASVDGTTREAPAGPAAVAVAATPEAVFVLEGLPTLDRGAVRVQRLERLDPETLGVVNDAPITGGPTDLAVDGETVWVITTGGVLNGYDATSLETREERRVEGRGIARLAVTRDAAWILNSRTADGVTDLLLHRLDRNSLTTEQTMTIPDAVSDASLTSGDRVWVGTGLPDVSGQGRLHSFGLDGSAYASVSIAWPAALWQTADWLWSVSTTGRLEAISLDLETTRSPVSIGTMAIDVVAAGETIWIASDELILVSAN
jgi:hypothetical protein